MLRSMDTAPRERRLTLRAVHLVVGLGPDDEPPFDTIAVLSPARILGDGGQTSERTSLFGVGTAQSARLDLLKNEIGPDCHPSR